MPPMDMRAHRENRVVLELRPWATNLVTGIATAYMDSVPMVITGNVPLQSAGAG